MKDFHESTKGTRESSTARQGLKVQAGGRKGAVRNFRVTLCRGVAYRALELLIQPSWIHCLCSLFQNRNTLGRALRSFHFWRLGYLCSGPDCPFLLLPLDRLQRVLQEDLIPSGAALIVPAMGTVGARQGPHLWAHIQTQSEPSTTQAGAQSPWLPCSWLGPWESNDLAAQPGPDRAPRASGPPAPNPGRHQPCRTLTLSILQRLAEKPIQKTLGIWPPPLYISNSNPLNNERLLNSKLISW